MGAAISVFPNALRAYPQVGLLDEIVRTNGQVTEVYLKTHWGTIVSKSRPQYDLPTLCLHRTDLHAILLRHSNAELHPNHTVTAILRRAAAPSRVPEKRWMPWWGPTGCTRSLGSTLDQLETDRHLFRLPPNQTDHLTGVE